MEEQDKSLVLRSNGSDPLSTSTSHIEKQLLD